jgi:O-antigen/teichoic acid export membrane protein
MNRSNRLIKESLLVIAAQVCSVVGILLVLKLTTHNITPEQYGYLTLAITFGTVITQVVLGGVTSGLNRFLSIAVENNELSELLDSMSEYFVYSLIFVVLFIFLCATFIWYFEKIAWLSLMISSTTLFLLNGYSAVLGGIQNFARKRGVVAFNAFVDMLLKIILIFFFSSIYELDALKIVLILNLSSVICLLLQVYFFRKNFPEWSFNYKNSKPNKYTPKIWKYSFPFYAWGCFTWVQQISDRWALGAFQPSDEVGQYSVLFQLGYAPISLLTGVTVVFLSPILYKIVGAGSNHINNKNAQKITERLFLICLIATIVISVIAYFCHQYIFSILVGKSYLKYSYLLPWFVLAGGIFSAGEIIGVRLMSLLKTNKMIKVKILTAILGLFLNLVGAWFLGLLGVTYAIVTFSLIYFAWMYFVSSSLLHKQ